METFDIPYQEVYQFISSWSTTVTPAASGKEQRIANWDHPRRGWEIEMVKSLDTVDLARAFFDRQMGKFRAFWFVPPCKNPDSPVSDPVKVRFDTDDFEVQIAYSAGTFTLKIIEVL